MIYAPHDISTNPDSLKRFLAQALSVVLNTSTSNLVLLPLANQAVANHEKLVLDEELDIMTIDGESYDALAELLQLSEPNQREIGSHLFTDRCKQAVGEGTALSDTAYGLIYDRLTYDPINDIDCGIEDLLKAIPKIVKSYHEDTVDALLDKASINHDDMSRNTKVVQAESYLTNTMGKAFCYSYLINEGKPTENVAILYQNAKEDTTRH